LRHDHRSVALAFAALVGLGGCGSSPEGPDAEIDLPDGDGDGGSVGGLVTTNLTDTTGGRFYVGAYAPDGGELLVGRAFGEAPFPVRYQVDGIPSGRQIIRALLDLPPYATQPLVEVPGTEDATGVYLNANSVLPVAVRPGLITTRVDFFVTRAPR
jgi:hypothetical protein